MGTGFQGTINDLVAEEYQLDPEEADYQTYSMNPYVYNFVATVMGGYEGHRGWINYLAVSPEHQRKGYARIIMQAVEVLIQQKGCPKINLLVRGTNSDVIKFYQAIGYDVENAVGLGKLLIPGD